MSDVYTKVTSGLNIKTLATSAAPAILGDLQPNTGTGNLQYHNGTAVANMVTDTNTLTLTNKTLDAGANTISNLVNANISASAAIAYSKLNLSGSILGSDISASAAIPYSKLSLAGSILNSDIASGAAIAYSKLNLAASIVNADISATAAIAYSKLNLAASIVNSDISATAAIAYSKLNLAGSVKLVSDVTGTLPIANGGTGQITAPLAFNALSPLTTLGDTLAYTGTTNTRLPVGTAGQVIVADSTQATGLRWTSLQQGAKNYITNSNFEGNSLTGYSLFNTTLSGVNPTTAPSGGAASLTAAVTSSGPIAGTYSLLLSSSGATTTGQGLITSALTIDREDQAKVLTYRFAYSVASGTSNLNFSGSSSNTFAVWIYDTANAAWIQPAGVYNLVQNSGVGICTGTFQTPANTTSLQLAIICINASGGAMSIQFDDFSVGPQSLVTAGVKANTRTVITSGSTYTTPSNPSPIALNITVIGGGGGGAGGGSSGTITAAGAGGSSSFGGTLLVAGGGGPGVYDSTGGAGGTASGVAPITGFDSVNGGSGTGVADSSATFRSGGDGGNSSIGGAGGGGATTLNGNSAAPNSGSGGGGGGNSAASGNNVGAGGGAGATAKGLLTNPLGSYAVVIGSGGTAGLGGTSNGGSGGAGKIIVEEIYAGSNVLLSSDSGNSTAVVAICRLTTGQTIPASNTTIINFNSVDYDTTGSVTAGSSWQFKAPSSGFYDVSFHLEAVNNAYSNNVQERVFLYKNGSPLYGMATWTSFNNPSTDPNWSGAGGCYLVAGDIINLQMQTAGDAIVLQTDIQRLYVYIAKRQSSAVIQASDSVNARYISTNTTGIATGTTVSIPMTSKDFDTHNAFNISTSTYTVPITGKYRVTYSANLVPGSTTQGQVYNLLLYKNGSAYQYFGQGQLRPTNSQVQAVGSCLVNCVAGDTIRAYIENNASSSVTPDGSSFANNIAFERIGN